MNLFKVIFFANSVGVAFGKLKNHEKAIVYYDKAIEIKPHYRDKYINIAYKALTSIKALHYQNLAKNKRL